MEEDKIRSGNRSSKKKKNVSIVTIIIFFIVVILEIVFLSHVMNGNLDTEVVEVFARLEEQEIQRKDIAFGQEKFSYNTNTPKAQYAEKKGIDKKRPMIALTFDDGPHPINTLRILEALKKYNASATFFMLGNRVNANPDIPSQIIAQGSEIGTHSMSHPNLVKLDDSEIEMQIGTSSKIINQKAGKKIQLLRPPYGSYNDVVKQKAKEYGLAIILWNVDTEDWKSRNADKIVEHVLTHVKDGDIILMHDIYDTSAEAAERILGELTKQGYQFVTVSELLHQKEIKLESGQKYYYAK